jgi:hypothetical protein
VFEEGKDPHHTGLSSQCDNADDDYDGGEDDEDDDDNDYDGDTRTTYN